MPRAPPWAGSCGRFDPVLDEPARIWILTGPTPAVRSGRKRLHYTFHSPIDARSADALSAFDR